MRAHVIRHHCRELVAGIIHRQNDTLHLQITIQTGAHRLDRAHQLCQPFQRIEFTLQRHQNRGRSRQRINRQHAKGWWTIYNNILILFAYFFQCHLQPEFPIRHVRQFDFGRGQIDDGRDDIEPRYLRRLNRRVGGATAGDDAVAVMRPVLNPEAGAGIALRVKINKQHRPAAGGQRGGKIDRGCCLSHTALLIGDGDDTLGLRHGLARLRARTPTGLSQNHPDW